MCAQAALATGSVLHALATAWPATRRGLTADSALIMIATLVFLAPNRTVGRASRRGRRLRLLAHYCCFWVPIGNPE
jgi:hypothetical protein